MLPLYGVLSVPYVFVRVTRGALVAHRYAHEPPPHKTFISLSVSLWNNLDYLYSMVWDWRVSRAGPMLFYWLSCLLPFCILHCFSHYLFSVYRLVLWGWGKAFYSSRPGCQPSRVRLIHFFLHYF